MSVCEKSHKFKVTGQWDSIPPGGVMHNGGTQQRGWCKGVMPCAHVLLCALAPQPPVRQMARASAWHQPLVLRTGSCKHTCAGLPT